MNRSKHAVMEYEKRNKKQFSQPVSSIFRLGNQYFQDIEKTDGYIL